MIIKIKNLKVRTIIGVYKHEKLKKRDLIFNVELETGIYKKGSDKLKDTLDYDAVANLIRRETEKSRYNLIEKLADDLMGKLMHIHGVRRIRLEIDKPGAIKGAESVSVTVMAKLTPTKFVAKPQVH